MAVAYFDCFAGISGDMCLGALVDAGVPLKRIERGLRDLRLRGYRLESERVKRGSVAATKVDVLLEPRKGNQQPKTWRETRRLVTESSLPAHIKEKGLKVFRRLYESEGRVHGVAYDKTHLHELGALDCFIDVFGTLIGLDHLGVEGIYVSAINLGSGTVQTKHGRLPVPAPATAEILRGVPVYTSDIPFELTTPTGAAIVRELGQGFGSMPLMNVETIGYGAGSREIGALPNTLRILVGELKQPQPSGHPKVTVIETNIDDMNPQLYEHLTERLFRAGALDVYLTQVIMKKGRPGIVLTVLCQADILTQITEIIFRESSTIGLRFHEASRMILERSTKEVITRFGPVKVKASRSPDGTVKCGAEYEECRKIARRYNVPLIDVMKEVLKRTR